MYTYTTRYTTRNLIVARDGKRAAIECGFGIALYSGSIKNERFVGVHVGLVATAPEAVEYLRSGILSARAATIHVSHKHRSPITQNCTQCQGYGVVGVSKTRPLGDTCPDCGGTGIVEMAP